MASLARLPELVGFFSYSREDDEAFRGSLSALRDTIQRELGAQLGRTKRNFRLWQDQEAIAPGKDWEAEITRAVEQSVFFIPIVTPRAVNSDYCKFEFSSFVARERALARGDLIFPILYISVPALLDEVEWRNDPVLSVVAKRQYVDWRPFRHNAVNSTAFAQAIERFCNKIVETLREPWHSAEERRQLEAEAGRRAEEAERLRLEAEAQWQAEEEEKLRKEARAKKQADEEDANLRRQEAETQRRLAEAAERQRQESEAKRRTEEKRRKPDEQTRAAVGARPWVESDVARLADASEPETQDQPPTPWRPSRRDWVIAGVLVAAMVAGAAAWRGQHRSEGEVRPQTTVTAPGSEQQKEEAHPPTTVTGPASAQQKEEAHLPTTVTAPTPAAQPQTAGSAPGPAAQPQTTAAAPAPAAENEEIHPSANLGTLTTAQERALKPGDSFKECSDCPEMIVVPAGRFTMGSPAVQGYNDEQHPQHLVTIGKPLAAAKFALTFDEWDACAARGGCRRDVSDEGWGRGRCPAINVTWEDAQTYVKWLSSVTGNPYRLLSEAEYEYAARAGGSTDYPWGDDIKLNGKPMANCVGCGSQWDGKQTAPVGSFAANAFGLHDMVGNVWEWTEDCWNPNYQGAPADGSPWTSGDCSNRVVRGGSWIINPRLLRSANRSWDSSDYRYSNLGFRVARTLAP
jgi:formylglycine-generating enzyme required for sulfatase activity